jgi:hypothetical protein
MPNHNPAGVGGNPKTQIPNSKQIPNPKLQLLHGEYGSRLGFGFL